MYVKISKINMLIWMYVLFGRNYRVVTLSTLYLTVLDIIILMLKFIRQSKLINQKVKNLHSDFLLMIIELFRFLKGTQLLQI